MERFQVDHCSWDPRHFHLGTRIYASAGGQSFIFPDDDFTPQDEDFYKTFRYLLGVGEGPELANQLPFNCNADFTDSIKLNKGCYLGQELCARTYYTGVIRKRLMTVIISDSPENLQKLLDKKDQRLPAADHGQKLARLDFVDSEFLQDLSHEERSNLFVEKTVKNSAGRKAFKIISVEKNVGLVIGDYFSAPDSFQDEIFSDGKYFYKLTFNGIWDGGRQGYLEGIKDRL